MCSDNLKMMMWSTEQSYMPVNPEVTEQCVVPSGQELYDRINCDGCQCPSCKVCNMMSCCVVTLSNRIPH